MKSKRIDIIKKLDDMGKAYDLGRKQAEKEEKEKVEKAKEVIMKGLPTLTTCQKIDKIFGDLGGKDEK